MMRKILSAMVAIAMVVAISVTAIVTVSAVEGDWLVFADKDSYAYDAEDVKSIPGYEYTRDGLHMIPADWSTTAPYGTFQTRDEIDLRAGVYMEVRVDDYTYSAGDKWFKFGIYDAPTDYFRDDDDSDYGGYVLIRPTAKTVGEGDGAVSVFNNLERLEWWTYLYKDKKVEIGRNAQGEEISVDENGRPILSLEIVYDRVSERYNFYVNGIAAPLGYNIAMTEYFKSLGHSAYISFSMQNSTMGGTVECTVLKFGENATDATVPVGTDGEEPIDNSVEYGEMQDASDVEEGMPAISMTGSVVNSDLRATPSSYLSNSIVINGDESVRVYGNANKQASIQFNVNNDVSFDAADFPIAAIIIRNFCSCEVFEECDSTETCRAFIRAGNIIQNTVQATVYAEEPLFPEMVGDDQYKLLVVDYSEYEGRIHGIRLDINNMLDTEDRNYFEICGIYYFDTVDSSVAFFNEYIEEKMEELDSEETETDTEEPETSSENEPDAEATETESMPETIETELETETVTKTETDTETDTVAEAESATETETDIETVETENEILGTEQIETSETEIETESLTETSLGSESDAETEKNETESGSEVTNKPESDTAQIESSSTSGEDNTAANESEKHSETQAKQESEGENGENDSTNSGCKSAVGYPVALLVVVCLIGVGFFKRER